jgi:signal transduction histidine kinase
VKLCARHSEDGRVLIAVRDSGKGIDPGVMPRTFDAFFTTKSNGIGIGLRIARSIIENHEGRLWATSNPGGGAALEFELPAKADEEGRK